VRRVGALVAGAILVASAANAEPRAPAVHPPLAQALKGDARVLYDSAKTLFGAGDYASAYAKFQRALELSSDPRLYWNMAACERKAKHNANVLRLIDSYLREGDAWLSDDEKKEASRAAAAVRAFVAAAKVTTEPADGVEVFVDDVRVATTPIDKPIWIDMGSHRVRFAKTGFRAVERSEEIPAGGDLTWSVELERAKETGGTPEVTPPPPPAHVEPPPAHVEPPPRSRSVGPLILGGFGLAIAIGGGVTLFLTTRQFSSLRDECGTSCDPARWKDDRTAQIVGDVLLATGGAMLGGAIVWWLATPASAASRAFVAPVPGGVVSGVVF
jgi:hypothetical protein